MCMCKCIVFIQLCSWNYTAYLTRNSKPLPSHLNPRFTDIVSFCLKFYQFLVNLPPCVPLFSASLSWYFVFFQSHHVSSKQFPSVLRVVWQPYGPYLFFGFLPGSFRRFSCFEKTDWFWPLPVSHHLISFVVFCFYFLLASNKYFWNHKTWSASNLWI